MATYLVSLPSRGGMPRFDGGNAMVVVAASAADALDAADAHFGADAAGLFNAVGSATEMTEADDLEGYTARAALLDASPVVDVTSTGVLGINPTLSVGSGITIEAGGASYNVDDIITLSDGATNDSNRAATFRVTTVSTGAVTGLELMDPGDYNTLSDDGSSTPLATTNDGSGDDNLTLSFGASFATTYQYGNLLAGLVTELNALTAIANAALDLSESASGARLLTVAGAADGLGDKQAVVEIKKNGYPVDGLISTITDEGSSGAAVTAALVASASLVLPNVAQVLRTV